MTQKEQKDLIKRMNDLGFRHHKYVHPDDGTIWHGFNHTSVNLEAGPFRINIPDSASGEEITQIAICKKVILKASLLGRKANAWEISSVLNKIIQGKPL